MRTPHQRSLVDESGAALELFENGISFDHSFRPKKAGQGLSSKQESSGGVSPTSQVPIGQSHITDSKSEAFLGKQQKDLEDSGGKTNKPGNRTATRKAFRELTNSLRTKKSWPNNFKGNAQARIQNMTRKHILRREEAKTPTASPTVDIWIDGAAQPAERAKTLPSSLPTIQHQEPLQMVGDVGIVSAPGRIHQDMSMLRNGVLSPESTKTGKENEGSHSVSAQGVSANDVPNFKTKEVDVEVQSAYTHITITTGSFRLKAEAPLNHCDALAAKKLEKPTKSCPENKLSISSKTEGTQIDTPKDTVPAVSANCQQGTRQHILKTTRGANRLQLRQKKADLDSEGTEPKPCKASQSLTESHQAPKVMLKVAYIEERKKKRETAVLSALTRTRSNHCGGCSECLRVGSCCDLMWRERLG